MAAILVTGGAGFIGSHLTERLLSRGDRVVVLDNFDDYYDPQVKRRNLAEAIRGSGAGDRAARCEVVEADIRDRDAVGRALEEHAVDAVVHLAARAGVRPSIADPLLYEEVNVRGTTVLLEACRARGVNRFVFGSSSSVYGDSVAVPFSEEARVDRPVSPYAATKLAGEALCHTYHHLFGMHVFCLRFFTVYGPRQRPEMAIHKFARLILEGRPLPRFGDGRTERDYTYIDDILDGLMRSLDRVEGYDVFNLGESKRVSLDYLIELLAAEIGRPALIERMPEQPGDVRVTCADVTRARQRLGYDPRVPIEEGIRRFVAWLKRETAA